MHFLSPLLFLSVCFPGGLVPSIFQTKFCVIFSSAQEFLSHFVISPSGHFLRFFDKILYASLGSAITFMLNKTGVQESRAYQVSLHKY